MGTACFFAVRRNTAKVIGRGIHSKHVLQHAKHIELENVPRSVKPSDIRRAIIRAELQGVSDVAVSYDRFLPAGRALITLVAPNFLQDNLRLLDRLTIAGTPVSAEPRIVEGSRHRTRGTKGRAEAEERGVAVGNGPHAGLLQNTGKTVVIWGFPGKMDIDLVAPYFNDFKVATSKNEKRRVQKVPLPDGAFTLFSRFVVTLESVSEAHRFVRHFHMTHFNPATFGEKYPLYARVVY